MRTIILSMQTSLDGFVTGPNNDMSWMNLTMTSNGNIFLICSKK